MKLTVGHTIIGEDDFIPRSNILFEHPLNLEFYQDICALVSDEKWDKYIGDAYASMFKIGMEYSRKFDKPIVVERKSTLLQRPLNNALHFNISMEDTIKSNGKVVDVIKTDYTIE